MSERTSILDNWFSSKWSQLPALGLVLLLQSFDAGAETTISVFTGDAWTKDSDVQLVQPGGTDLTFHDVSWSTKPFDMPPYYAVRVTHWFDRYPEWGVAADFTHAKMYSELDDQVLVTGERSGVPVHDSERLDDSFETLEFTDGHNLLTLNAVRRWSPFANDSFSRFRDSSRYGGVGIGVAMPHVEVVTADTNTIEYQFAGPAVQGILGANFPINRRFAFSVEYRLTYADLDTDLDGGGSLSTEALTHHLNFGVGFSFGNLD
jgi:lipid A oxidase